MTQFYISSSLQSQDDNAQNKVKLFPLISDPTIETEIPGEQRTTEISVPTIGTERYLEYR